ncbi:hypothetical protein BCSJ1_25933, partial [Bacillus cereus SJ1]
QPGHGQHGVLRRRENQARAGPLPVARHPRRRRPRDPIPFGLQWDCYSDTPQRIELEEPVAPTKREGGL